MSLFIRYHCRGCALVLLSVALLIGCVERGPELYEVRGQVTFQGKPLTTGTVMFTPEEGPAAATTISPDGHYELKVVAGRHAVSVIAQPRWPEGFDPAKMPANWLPPAPLVPPKFNRPSTSGLTVDVQPTNNNDANLLLVE